MGKLFKFLKPRVGAVLAIVAVLIIQAYCDLSLPGYTSDIVNVGIQQGGIDSAIPEQIAKDDMEKLLPVSSVCSSQNLNQIQISTALVFQGYQLISLPYLHLSTYRL